MAAGEVEPVDQPAAVGGEHGQVPAVAQDLLV
jgi:hypothetical protein